MSRILFERRIEFSDPERGSETLDPERDLADALAQRWDEAEMQVLLADPLHGQKTSRHTLAQVRKERRRVWDKCSTLLFYLAIDILVI